MRKRLFDSDRTEAKRLVNDMLRAGFQIKRAAWMEAENKEGEYWSLVFCMQDGSTKENYAEIQNFMKNRKYDIDVTEISLFGPETCDVRNFYDAEEIKFPRLIQL